MDADNISIHSAAKSCNLEAAELLLREKVDIYGKDDKGMTPLHILMQRRIEMFSSLNKNQKKQSLAHDIEKNKQFIEMLLKYASSDLSCTDDAQLLNFHAACMVENCATTESFLEKIEDVNQPISENNSIWPGYTGLHFAAHCHNVNTIKILVANGGNLLACDKSAVTALDICIKSFKPKKLCLIMNSVSEWKDILFSDGKTKLMDYMSVLHDEDNHKKFVQSMGKDVKAPLTKDSPLWPGQTILHIAVTILQESNLYMIRHILGQGADVTIQDVNDSTPVHLAFCQNKFELLYVLLRHHKKFLNPLSKDNLSHLHITSAMNDTNVVRKLLTNEENINIAYSGNPLPNVKPGWTPLHTACVTEHSNVARMLLEAGANQFQADTEGFTPIHRLFGINRKKHLALEVLIASGKFKECVVESIGLTHLHVMASYDKTEVVKCLLDQGANIEATIKNVEGKSLKQFAGYRPLHLATEYHHSKTVKLLLENGADILAKKPNGTSPLFEALCGKYDESLLEPFVSLLWADKKLQKRVEKEIGLTMLHVVCYALDLDKINDLLKNKIDVNAKVHEDSLIWPGFTPLHVLTHLGVAIAHSKDIKENVDKSISLLLGNKADVTLINTVGNTPVHLTLESRFKDQRSIRASLLMNHHRDFSINPTNKQGVSHFHIACFVCNSTAVRGFLQHGVNVNQPINKIDGEFGGKFPLHLAVNAAARKISGAKFQLHVVDTLLNKGAKVDVVDSRGWTLIHNVAECGPLRQKLVERILRPNTDVNKETINGATPFEILLHHGPSVDEVKLFIELGSRVNSYNRISNVGYMAMVITRTRGDNRINLLNLMMSQPDIAEVDKRGRNAIYNAICGRRMYLSRDEYASLVEKLIHLGCNINQQDCDGKTPLHVAIELCDENAVRAFLRCGADINLVDSAGHSTFSYASNNQDGYSYMGIVTVVITHSRILQLMGYEVSQLNARLLAEVHYKIEVDEITLRAQLEKTREVKIGQRGLTLYDFVCERSVGKLISLFIPAERDILGSVLVSIDYEKFGGLSNVLKVQYRKFLERLPLMTPAKKSFISLLGFPLPDLCIEIVFKFLSNVELKKLVSATIDNDDSEMVTD